MDKFVISRGPCPETGGLGEIRVRFHYIQGTVSFGSGFKRDGYACRYAEEHGCAAKGETGADCPLYRSARI